VYAHTVLTLKSTASQWPLFRTLGNKSLGSTLFGDPQVVRGALQYARLQPNHPAMQRAHHLTRQNLGGETNSQFFHPLFARRSLFFRRGGVMLVTELFLPAVAQLKINLNIK
jgi:chorismate--pyruvate lyase